MKAMIKSVGRSGQISIGKEFAGRTVLVEKIDSGVWLIKLGDFIPDNERWLQLSAIQSDLDEAVAWAEQHSPKPANLDELEASIQS
ncbi:MAG: hypothetical protein V1844_15470 [Pseudomonadota bacterium]